MTTENDLRQMARMADTAADMAMAGQAASMKVLLAEMRALSALLPAFGAAPVSPDSAEEEARLLAREAETEAGFDNMPV